MKQLNEIINAARKAKRIRTRNKDQYQELLLKIRRNVDGLIESSNTQINIGGSGNLQESVNNGGSISQTMIGAKNSKQVVK